MTSRNVVLLGVAALLLGAGYYLFTYITAETTGNKNQVVSVLVQPVQSAQPTGHRHEFKGTQEEAQYFMDKNREIVLTPDQEAMFLAALDQKDSQGNPTVPAPCCADKTAATCCCECNLARTIWGLSKSLIVDGADATEVRMAVLAWTYALNPAGYAGLKRVEDSTCYVGGCEKSIKSDGCGGMDEKHLVL